MDYIVADAIKALEELMVRREGEPEFLPCPVLLEPGLRFGKGVKTQLLFDALKRRAEYYAELDAMTPEQRAEHDAGIAEFKAMLSGNSPATPDGWIKCSERMPEDEQEVLTRNRMGHCFVSFFDEHSGLFFDRVDVAAACCIEHILVTHWMPLPAAPQQDVRLALEIGMSRYAGAMQKLVDSGD